MLGWHLGSPILFSLCSCCNNIVPTHTTNYDDGQFQYILATKGEDSNVSERVRELVDKGMEAEQDG